MTKQLLFTFLLSMMGAYASSQHIEQPKLPGMPESMVVINRISKESPSIQKFRLANPKTAKASKASDVKAKFTFPELNKEWLMPWSVTAFDGERFFSIEVEQNDEDGNPAIVTEQEFEIPKGTYDFIASFNKINPDNFFKEDPEVIYIAEQVEVKDGTIISLKPQNSNICLEMKTTNPNGEETRFRKVRYLNDDNWDFEIIEEGNVASPTIHKIIKIDGHIVRDLTLGTSGVTIEPGPKGYSDNQQYCNVHVNKVSDRVVFQNMTAMTAWPNEDNGVYMAITQCQGSKPGTYINNPDYTLDESTIAATPAYRKYPPQPEYEGANILPYAFSFTTYNPETPRIQSTIISSPYSHIWKTWYSGPANIIDKDDLFLFTDKTFLDAEIKYEDEWGGYTINYNTSAPTTFPYSPDGITTIVNGTPYSDYLYAPDRQYFQWWIYPANAPYLSEVKNPSRIYAASAPLLTFNTMPSWQWNDGRFSMIDNYNIQYNGRVGELMESTAALADVSLNVDGTKVASGQEETKAWLASHTGEIGTREYTVETDNFDADGITGGNTAVISCHANNSVPSATMLQFRDKQGSPTHSFDKAENIDMLLSAAVFNLIFDDEPSEQGDYWTWFELSTPSKVTATCRPTLNSDAPETKIALTEDPDAFYSLQYGALYHGSLSNVSTSAPSGWFDLTITVESESGNRQVQTISPAFRIEELASVGNVSCDSSVSVEGRNIIAPTGSRVYSLSGIETGCQNLSPGIYIVRNSSGGVTKVVIK